MSTIQPIVKLKQKVNTFRLFNKLQRFVKLPAIHPDDTKYHHNIKPINVQSSSSKVFNLGLKSRLADNVGCKFHNVIIVCLIKKTEMDC